MARVQHGLARAAVERRAGATELDQAAGAGPHVVATAGSAVVPCNTAAVTFTDRDRDAEDQARARAWAERLEQLGHLYRYTGLQGDGFRWFENLVLNSEMYFTEFRKLNDPFDGAVQLIFNDATEQEIRDYWSDWAAEECTTPNASQLARIDELATRGHDPIILQDIQNAHDREIGKLGVRCFSELRDDLPMWGYYADSHRGVCLRFRAPRLLQLEGCFPPTPVTYADLYPAISFYRDTRFKRILTIVATKAKVWAHEREWRIVRTPYGAMKIDPAALDGVIMGCRIPPKDEAKVRTVRAKRTPTVELFKAHVAEREFKLEIRPA